MTPAGLDDVTTGMLLDEVDIAHQGRACIPAFQQVVAQNEIFRKPTIHGLAKRINVIDALADERALPESILVDIRDLAGIRIDTRVTGEQPGES